MVPNVVRTWAPRGQTPIHRHRQGRRDKISVISGISVSPKRRRLGLYYLLFYDNIGQDEVCVFLRELLRHLRGPVVLLLDHSSTHKGAPIELLLHRHRRLRIEYFPSYAPQLNDRESPPALPGDPSSLTFTGVHPRNSKREPPSARRGESGWTNMKA